MASHGPTGGASRAARILGLKVPVYEHLRRELARGEHPITLRVADPALAGMFPNAFGFELLLERFRHVEAMERRRANLLRALDEREDVEDLRASVEEAVDEGELEDLGLAVEPSRPPQGVEDPDKEEHAAFVQSLRGDWKVARALRRAFHERGTVTVEKVEDCKEDAKRFHALAGPARPLTELEPQRYLQLRRGERAHGIRLDFGFASGDVDRVFADEVSGFPAQEKDSYRALFERFVEQERLPRLVQGVRAQLKRRAEEEALQQGWNQVEQALDRGRQDGLVVGLSANRRGRLVVAATHDLTETPRTMECGAREDDVAEKVLAFLGEEAPAVVAFQADAGTRAAAQKVIKTLRDRGAKVRAALVPMAVVKTMLREVARRPCEALLSHDERQAFLLAALAMDPRAAALHTPHVVRAYIPYRGEINHRILDEFEDTFLRSLLYARGVDVNVAPEDALRRVPGLRAEDVVAERSTAPFRSLDDFQARMGLHPRDWRAACCLLRVRGGDEPLDRRPLHPRFYPALRAAAERAGRSVVDLMREPNGVKDLPWDEVLTGEEHADGIVECIRRGLMKPGRRRPRPRQEEGRRLETLQVGASLKGVVKNITDYGAFVDVGARREGLVHVSHCSERFVKHPSEVLDVGHEVEVRVLSVDVASQKFRLSLLTEEQEKERAAQKRKRREGGGRPQRGGKPGRGRDRGRGRRRDDDPGPDPRAKHEEIDPTNPFYRFFKEQGGDVASDAETLSSDEGAARGKSGSGRGGSG